MKMNKLQVIYILNVLLILIIFSNRSYNSVGELGFVLPVIIVSLLIGVMSAWLFAKNMRLYKNLYFISYIITIGFAFVPALGVYIESGHHHYGYPAQWFSYYYISGGVSFNLLGFLFNFVIIYFILRLLFNKKINRSYPSRERGI